MPRQVLKNPTNNKSITLTTYSFASTSTNGTVTSGSDISAITLGQSVFLDITGGTAEGFTTLQEYFAIPVDANNIKLASTYNNAVAGVNITTTGNAGGGTIFPTYRVGGVLWIGTGSELNIRGLDSDTFSIHKNLPDGDFFPCMIKDISAHSLTGTVASDLVAWVQ